MNAQATLNLHNPSGAQTPSAKQRQVRERPPPPEQYAAG